MFIHFFTGHRNRQTENSLTDSDRLTTGRDRFLTVLTVLHTDNSGYGCMDSDQAARTQKDKQSQVWNVILE